MIDKNRLKTLLEEESNITNAAKKLAKELGVEFTDSFRRKCSKTLQKDGIKKDEDLDNTTESITTDYKKSVKGFTAIASDGSLMNIEQYCTHYGLDVSKIRSYKLISHSGIPFYNCVFYTQEEETLLDIDQHLEDIVKKYVSPITKIESGRNPDYSGWVDRLVYTDVHLGMSVQGNGDPLYDGKWDREEALRRLDIMVKHTLLYKKSKTLIIDDLGDYLDGLGGETTRKGHKLPQNMNDKEVFDLGLEFKIKLVDALINHYEFIICNNLVEDNHSGVFGYFVGSAVRQVLEHKYPKSVEVHNHKKFINHYKIGLHTIVLSHGKDSEALKFGFKPHLDDRQAKKIDHYCKENLLYDGNLIEFSKGDSHLGLFDDSTSTDFQYYNYPSFSPPSNWVKSNFSNTVSGFRFFNIDTQSKQKIHIPYIF